MNHRVYTASYRPGGGETICAPPIAVRLAADLRPSADASAVRTSLVAGKLQAASVPIAYAAAPRSQRFYSLGWDRQTDERIAVSVIAPLRRGNNIGSHDLEGGGLAQSKETPCIRPPLVRSRPSPTLSHLVQQQKQQRGSHKSDRRRGDDRGRAGRARAAGEYRSIRAR